MLSTGAFNALLKTLEEPPAYVIFILATTEVNKIPDYDPFHVVSGMIFNGSRMDTIAGPSDVN